MNRQTVSIFQRDLKVGDQISLGEGPFMDAIVIAESEEYFHVRRPFAYSLDCSDYYAGAVGQENFGLYKDSNKTVELMKAA